jgi:sugar (pentulose or hexulose) kinase
MRCYSNGAQFLDRIVGAKPDWDALERAARNVPAGCNGTGVLPFVLTEPSLGINEPRYEWYPNEPTDPGVRFRAALEALAYLIGLGIREHRNAGQAISRITVSGGIAKSNLMCEILASVLNHPLDRLISNEGPALGAAVAALAGLETHLRRASGIEGGYGVADAVSTMVRFRDAVQPVGEWQVDYRKGLTAFEERMRK